MQSPTPTRLRHGGPVNIDNIPARTVEAVDADDASLYNGAPADDMDLFSLAAESVVSMTETVVTGIRTSLSHWKIILFGQVLALLMGLRGGTTAFLYLECDVMAPTFQLWWVYLILSTHLFCHAYSSGNRLPAEPPSNAVFDLSILQLHKPKFSAPEHKLPCTSMTLHTQWWKYLILSILDLEGNYFTYLALKYTSLKSASLLDTLTIPTAMLASYLFLRKRYSCSHLVGAAICLGGAMIMIFADYSEEQSSNQASANDSQMTLEQEVYNAEQSKIDNYNDPYEVLPTYDDIISGAGDSNQINDTSGIMNSLTVRGDFLAAIGGMFWGLKDTMAEGVLQVSSQTEFLGMLGMYGLLLATLQIAVLEGPIVKDFLTGFSDSSYNTCSATQTYGIFFAIIIVFVLYYLGISRFLHISEAALLQLSLLAADLYAVLFSIVEERKLPTWLFVVSMITILLGVMVYESVPAPTTTDARLFGAYAQSPTRERQRQLRKQNIQEPQNGAALSEEDRHHLGVLGISHEDLTFEHEVELATMGPSRTNPGRTSVDGRGPPSSFEIL